MNAEVIRAMNKKETKIDAFRKWWSKNGYKVMRVILFPIWWGICVKNKIETWLNSRQTWSEEKANEVLSYYVPRKAGWCEEDKTFYFFDNGTGWSIGCAKKYLKLKDRRWWDNHGDHVGGKVRSYLIDKFELEGFTKEVGDCSNGWTEISFVMTEK